MTAIHDLLDRSTRDFALAGDVASVRAACATWLDHHGGLLALHGAPHVVWAGSTSAGPAAYVTQRIHDHLEPATLQAFGGFVSGAARRRDVVGYAETIVAPDAPRVSAAVALPSTVPPHRKVVRIERALPGAAEVWPADRFRGRERLLPWASAATAPFADRVGIDAGDRHLHWTIWGVTRFPARVIAAVGRPDETPTPRSAAWTCGCACPAGRASWPPPRTPACATAPRPAAGSPSRAMPRCCPPPRPRRR